MNLMRFLLRSSRRIVIVCDDRRGGRRRDRHRAHRADPARAGARVVRAGEYGLGLRRALRGIGLGTGRSPRSHGQGWGKGRSPSSACTSSVTL